MKVLWVCNVPNQDACSFLNIRGINVGGWLTGLSNSLKSKDIELVYCFPLNSKQQKSFVIEGIHYYSFFSKSFFGATLNTYCELSKQHIKEILINENPDVLHIFGTEYIHSLLFEEAFERKNHICCSIQGLTSIYAKHYLSLLPYKVIHSFNFSCLFRGTLAKQSKKLAKRGKNEIVLLNRIQNVIGRTEWDLFSSYFINKQIRYFKCNESLRSGFYDFRWSYSKCNKFTIFMSQSSSPIKGLNVVLEAIHLLKNDYPNISLRIAGNNFIDKSSLMNRLKFSTYASYINKLIKKYKLRNNVLFLGGLDEEKMINEYLRCNVYVSASSIENSSNSIGEAMLLGTPVISSDVGGVKTLLDHGIEGFIYQADASYMLAGFIKEIFDSPTLASKMGELAHRRASTTHNREINALTLMDIYNTILEGK